MTLPVDMNTAITILSFLVSLAVQIIALAYYAGKFTEMLKTNRKDFEDHKAESIAKYADLRTTISIIEKEKQSEYSEFRVKIASHDQIMNSIEDTIKELKEAIKEFGKLVQEIASKKR